MKQKSILFILSLLFLSFILPTNQNRAFAASQRNVDEFAFVLLDTYDETVNIGEEFYLFAFTSSCKQPTFKSSNSKIASVNTYGLITAKKPGTVKITAKIKNAEASCVVTVRKTTLTLSHKKASLECNQTLQLGATTSNHSTVKYRSSRSSIASVDETGLITAKKPGETTITVTADTTTTTCKITVKKPSLSINQTSATLYRLQQLHLNCNVSSGKIPVWKSNKKSVATVDENGVVTAMKHGTAIITAKVDGVSKSCTITVKQPYVTLNEQEIELILGDCVSLTATVSSGNIPTWTCSNTSILSVEQGLVTGLSKGTAYVYASEDGIKARCKVKVILPKENQ